MLDYEINLLNIIGKILSKHRSSYGMIQKCKDVALTHIALVQCFPTRVHGLLSPQTALDESASSRGKQVWIIFSMTILSTL